MIIFYSIVLTFFNDHTNGEDDNTNSNHLTSVYVFLGFKCALDNLVINIPDLNMIDL